MADSLAKHVMAALPVVNNQRDFALAKNAELIGFLEQAILAFVEGDLTKNSTVSARNSHQAVGAGLA
jgi:hypothetical protein